MPKALLALSRAIQAEPTTPKTALIVIESEPDSAQEPEIAETQFTDVIQAPVDATKVFAALARAVNPSAPSASAAGTDPACPSGSFLPILIAEDNLINQKLLRRMLKNRAIPFTSQPTAAKPSKTGRKTITHSY